MADFFPRGDDELQVWSTNFINELPDVMTSLSLPATFDDNLVSTRTAFFTANNAHLTAMGAATAARSTKDDAKDTFMAELRSVVRQLRANPAFTDAMASALLLPIYDDQGTATEAILDDVPVLVVDTSVVQKHTIDFRNAGGSGRAKPSWARACRIMCAIVATGQGAPPLEQMVYLSTDTATPYTWDIPGEHVGKDIWYRGAWESPTGDLGAWSDPAKGTVTG